MSKPRIVFYVYDDLDRPLDIITLKENSRSESKVDEGCELASNPPKTFQVVFEMDGYLMSLFTRLLNDSPEYSRMVANNFLNNSKITPRGNEISAKFQLVKPKLDVIDYGWNERLLDLLVERRELDHAMSWLSTLGGAFSALGDNFENCVSINFTKNQSFPTQARVAGKISIQQFKIAFRLGEPPLVARCRLYMALSLIQLGKLVTAKNLVEEQYQLAKDFKDSRLQNMCKGVWAKLQYIYKQKKLNNKNT